MIAGGHGVQYRPPTPLGPTTNVEWLLAPFRRAGTFSPCRLQENFFAEVRVERLGKTSWAVHRDADSSHQRDDSQSRRAMSAIRGRSSSSNSSKLMRYASRWLFPSKTICSSSGEGLVHHGRHAVLRAERRPRTALAIGEEAAEVRLGGQFQRADVECFLGLVQVDPACGRITAIT